MSDCNHIFKVQPVNSFLVDTGSIVSIVPHNLYPENNPKNKPLYAANGSKIETYGKIKLNLKLNNKNYP